MHTRDKLRSEYSVLNYISRILTWYVCVCVFASRRQIRNLTLTPLQFARLYPKSAIVGKQMYVQWVVVWIQLMVTQYFEDPHSCYSPSYRASSHELLHSSLSTATIMVSLFRIFTVRGRPAFTSDEGLDTSCHVETPSKHISDLMTRPGWRSAYSHALVLNAFLQEPRVEHVAVFLVCVLWSFIRSKSLVGPSSSWQHC
jgi:hypothetical protein